MFRSLSIEYKNWRNKKAIEAKNKTPVLLSILHFAVVETTREREG